MDCTKFVVNAQFASSSKERIFLPQPTNFNFFIDKKNKKQVLST